MSLPIEPRPVEMPGDAFGPDLIEPCGGSQPLGAEAPPALDPSAREVVCSKPEGEEDDDFDEDDFDDDFDDDFEDELDEELNDDLDEFDEDIEEGQVDPEADDDAAFEEEDF